MKIKAFFALVLSSILLVSCNNSANEVNKSETDQSVNIKEMIQGYSTGVLEAKSASVTAQELTIVDPKGNEEVYEMTGEKFFVSIAPLSTKHILAHTIVYPGAREK